MQRVVGAEPGWGGTFDQFWTFPLDHDAGNTGDQYFWVEIFSAKIFTHDADNGTTLGLANLGVNGVDLQLAVLKRGHVLLIGVLGAVTASTVVHDRHVKCAGLFQMCPCGHADHHRL